MDAKEVLNIFDPIAVCCRSTSMMITVDPATSKSVSARVRLAGNGVRGLGQVNQRSMVNDKKTARADWISHIKRIKDGQDQKAFAELFQHFAPRVKAFLMKSGADATLAEECAQEVMATLWHKAHMFDPARASVATWIFTIARNRKIDLLRKQRRPEPEELSWGPEAEPDQEDTLVLQQESELLRQALAELPDAQRQLIERAYFGDLSHSQIAAETGLPLGTIKSRIRLALDRLRHAMK